MKLDRRRLLTSLAATAVAAPLLPFSSLAARSPGPGRNRPLRTFRGEVDWDAVRALFPLSQEWTHLASFLLVSHPRPVAEAIEHFRKKIDADPVWVEIAALTDSEGRPFAAVKRAIAEYVGGQPNEVCMTSNTTTALALAYHGLRIRADQEILTTEHDHYSHHESIRYAAERSGARVRYVALYDTGATADATQMAERVARAIRPTTRAVGVTWVHSSTGVKLPVADLAAVVARANRGRTDADRCLLIVDGVHGFGAQDARVARLGCDFFASGLHKWMFAPRGTGFLWGASDAWRQMRPTIPAFDPDGMVTWDAWMNRKPLPPTQAAFVSPGGFLAFEHVLAIPAAFEMHRTIGRDQIASRIDELSTAFKDGASKIRGVTMHTPRDPRLSAGISCFDVAGLPAEAVTQRLTAKKFRTTSSPYKTSHARVATGIMNTPAEIERVLRAIREIAT